MQGLQGDFRRYSEDQHAKHTYLTTSLVFSSGGWSDGELGAQVSHSPEDTTCRCQRGDYRLAAPGSPALPHSCTQHPHCWERHSSLAAVTSGQRGIFSTEGSYLNCLIILSINQI